ncbi:MAG: hypothetical protein QXX41_08965 [Nitrososphaerota archaeon]
MSRRIIPGYAPPLCPQCRSNFIVSGFKRVVWKRLVAPRIEVEEPVEVPVYYCGECGYIISRAFLDKEVTVWGDDVVESYLVEDVDGVIHVLAHTPDHPIRPVYGAVGFSGAVKRRAEGVFLSVIVEAPITYKNVYCVYEYPVGSVAAVPTERVETIVRKARYVREYTARHLRDFHELIRRVRSAGFKPTIREGILAYLVACALSEPKYGGTKSLITGFLRSSDVPEFRDVSPSSVGEALSRIENLGITPPEFNDMWRVVERVVDGVPVYSYVPVNRILQEKEYIIRRELPEKLFAKKEWWNILRVERRREVPKFVGLERWL